MEINSDDSSEYLQKNFITGGYNFLFRRLSLKCADAFVFVTEELSGSRSFAGMSRNRTVIGNGIDVSDFMFKECTGNEKPQLLFVGSPGQSWHGLDKILTLASQFKECVINIVGPDEKECKRIWGETPENIVFHGYLSNEDVKDLACTMDVGIGTLALHRKR
ncbi:hypothetical protein MBH78_15430 [Oceanimonas sp. NS1]|nr:hypothetical protein [Oceanimonas sp. NS1]